MYHWDSCQRKNVAIDFDVSASSSTAMSDFRYRILLEFYDEGLRENFRLYTLPRDFTDVNQRSRIESWGEILQYLTNLSQSITRSPLLYVFNSNDDLTPTKLPVPIVVQQRAATSESNSQSSKSSRDKRAADSVRERDGNSCVLCGFCSNINIFISDHIFASSIISIDHYYLDFLLLLLPVAAPALVQQGQKSVSFRLVPFVPVYHWDSCQRKKGNILSRGAKSLTTRCNRVFC